MKAFWTTVGVVVVAVLAIGAFYMIDIDQTREAALPDVDVTVEGGQLPAYDVDTGSIEVTEETSEITVPDVDVSVDTETAEVTTPGLEVNPPADDEG